MTIYRMSVAMVISSLMAVAISGCGGGGGDDDLPQGVTIQGDVDDGTTNSRIAGARCRFVDHMDIARAVGVTGDNGQFEMVLQPELQGFVECHPEGRPNLTLSTFASTQGLPLGSVTSILRSVSPSQTVVSNIINQENSPDPLLRHQQLTAALEEGDPDLINLTEAATGLFNAMRQQSINSPNFAETSDTNTTGKADSGGTGSGAEGGDEEGEGDGDGDGGGSNGDAGDGGAFSPLVNGQCEFASDLRGDTALEDYFSDGQLDLPELQVIADLVPQNPDLSSAFAKFFPNGMQPLVEGQPLRTQTDTAGHYDLPVPTRPGLVICNDPNSNFSLNTFIRDRGDGEILDNQHVSPPSQFFVSAILPQLNEVVSQVDIDIASIKNNFITDIGDINIPTNGIVMVETMDTADGTIVADIDGDGSACGFTTVPGEQIYPAAAASSYTASILFKALAVEARSTPSASYADILMGILTRLSPTGDADVTVLPEDLVSGGVPAERSGTLADLLNDCIETGVITILGPPLRNRMVRAGRLKLLVENSAGEPVPNAEAVVEGDIDGLSSGTACGPDVPPENQIKSDTSIACPTNADGFVVFVLLGKQSLMPTPLSLTITSEDGSVTAQKNIYFAPPATFDERITLAP